MKVILHIGAHRTGTTSLQSYVHRHRGALRDAGLAYWGPARTRKGLFAGIQPAPHLDLHAARRARGRILLQMDKVARNGASALLVSEENMMGSVRLNIRTRRLYRDIGQRLSRYVHAFDGQVDTVVLSVRGLDAYWGSAICYGVARGHCVPDADACRDIAAARRTWQDVIVDVACAAPKARIVVIPFERAIGRADAVVSACTGLDTPRDGAPEWLNRAPDAATLRAILADRGEDPDQVPDGAGRWTPFDAATRAQLRENYADDMHWLIAGADGLATLTEDLDHKSAGQTLPMGPMTKGQGHDIEERRVAQPC